MAAESSKSAELHAEHIDFEILENNSKEALQKFKGETGRDVFDHLGIMFKFQEGNVRNQRENVIHLLTNTQLILSGIAREDKRLLITEAINRVAERTLDNYYRWEKYSSKWLGNSKKFDSEKLPLVCLYFLIWGEAANLRFMPECLCFIFHHMAIDFWRSPRQYASETFLNGVVKPVYMILQMEVESSNKPHSKWANYDDINELFWSGRCLKLFEWGYDKRFKKLDAENYKVQWKTFVKKHGKKVNFLERRSFLHIFHSFHRLWIFLVMMLQGLTIYAFHGKVDMACFRNLLSLGPTHSLMMLFQSILDVILTFDPNLIKRFWEYTLQKARILIQLLFYASCATALTYLYVEVIRQQNNEESNIFTIYKYVIAIYTAAHVVHIVGYSSMNCFSSEPVKWLFKEYYFVGRNIRVKAMDFIKYTLFWFFLLSAKFTVSYYIQIKPLVKPTKTIVDMRELEYTWHDFVSRRNYNVLTVASLWTPILLIYFLDTQIWYTVFSAIIGSLNGALSKLGEMRSQAMFNDYFINLPKKFWKRLVNSDKLSHKGYKKKLSMFAAHWNEIVKSLRNEDYINNREMELLLMPEVQQTTGPQWPLFILLNQVQTAFSLVDKELELSRQLRKDNYMRNGVEEIINNISRIRELPNNANLNKESKTALEELRNSFSDLNKGHDLGKTFRSLAKKLRSEKTEIESAMNVLKNHTKDEKELYDLVERLAELLFPRSSAMSVPQNKDAKRRLLFFGTSLRMKMPDPPSVEEMLSFSVLTPHLDEEVIYSIDYLCETNRDGISNLFYLQRVYADEWSNFLERKGFTEEIINILIGIHKAGEGTTRQKLEQEFEEKLKKGREEVSDALMSLRLWASYRGQTLARTVRGMMLYAEALKFQYKQESHVEPSNIDQDRLANILANLKFTYVVTCQNFGEFIKKKTKMADDIQYLMKQHPDMRVAYIDKRKDADKKEIYTSKLVMWQGGEMREMYSIELPGNFRLGEGKPENQNHAIIFTRGDALQTIDMNQDNYFEEASKMRNLLEEFKIRNYYKKALKTSPSLDKLNINRFKRTILGVREHIFTGSVSSLAWFMSNQETIFVTLGQRVMANPLKVRMHYGHPDVFDRIFHITRGGISKASKTINLSEDIFAGYNSTLRGGNITHHEYIQVGKGRDLGLNQISAFEAKVSSGNGEQMLSRDVYRLGRSFDFPRMLSFYYTSVGYYISTLMVVLALYAFLYGKVYMALSGVERSIEEKAHTDNNRALETAMTTQFLFQIGTFNWFPMVMGYVLEQGVLKAIQYFLLMLFLFSSCFFAFSLATRSHYFGRTLLHGGAMYRKTGRGFVIEHIQFAENYRFYSRSHFIRGLELVVLLVVYFAYGNARGTQYILFSFSNWFLAFCWLYAPFIFNPLGFEWQKTVDDITNWNNWLTNRNAGAGDQQSWVTWFEKQSQLGGWRASLVEIILSLRFFIFQYGVVYQLKAGGGNKSLLLYALSWVLFVGVAVMLAFTSVTSTSGNKLRIAHGLTFMLLLGAFAAGCITLMKIKITDVLACILALVPTGWGLLCIAVACKPILEYLRLWWMVSTWAWCYDTVMGYIIFSPVIFLSWFPFISPLHSRILYNQAFSRGLEISILLAGKQA